MIPRHGNALFTLAKAGTAGVGLLIEVASRTAAARFASVIEAAAVIPNAPFAAAVDGKLPLEFVTGDCVALGAAAPVGGKTLSCSAAFCWAVDGAGAADSAAAELLLCAVIVRC